jgi:hypothetical protein
MRHCGLKEQDGGDRLGGRKQEHPHYNHEIGSVRVVIEILTPGQTGPDRLVNKVDQIGQSVNIPVASRANRQYRVW